MECGFNSPVEAARELIRQYNTEAPPIDVVDICQREGIQIAYVDLTDVEQRAGKEISGAIRKDGTNYIIFVNGQDIATRTRFTIAHELGHYFLHMKASPCEVITSFRMDQSFIETQANKFAAELLMPEDMVRAEHSKMVIPVSDSLAKKFNVSKKAMRIRLENLGLLYV